MSGKIGDSASTFKIADPVVLKIADPRPTSRARVREKYLFPACFEGPHFPSHRYSTCLAIRSLKLCQLTSAKAANACMS